jgi:flagellar transcriptional activator FlhC
VHSLDIHSNHICGLCNIPSRAGKTKKAAENNSAVDQALAI